MLNDIFNSNTGDDTKIKKIKMAKKTATKIIDYIANNLHNQKSLVAETAFL